MKHWEHKANECHSRQKDVYTDGTLLSYSLHNRLYKLYNL